MCSRAIVIAGGKVLTDSTPAGLLAPGRSLEQVFRGLTMPKELA